MPREFSSNEAKELIFFYNALLNNTDKVNGYRERNQTEVNAQIDSIVGRAACTGNAFLL